MKEEGDVRLMRRMEGRYDSFWLVAMSWVNNSPAP